MGALSPDRDVTQTLFHWDLPLALEKEYNGFLSRRVVPDFERYARVCFDAFGDLVKNWFTINGMCPVMSRSVYEGYVLITSA